MRLSSSAEQSGIDFDGLLTLAFSILLIFITFGISLLIEAWRCYQVAKHTQHIPNAEQVDVRLSILFGNKLSQISEVRNDYRIRLDKSLWFLRHNPERHLIILGGKTGKHSISEARAGLNHLLNSGLTENHHIFLEESSRNTLENLKEARKHLTSRLNIPLHYPIGFITNRYHLHRCNEMAKGLGYRPVLIASEEHFKCTPSECYKIFIEAFYIHWYHAGKLISKLFKSKRMLGKIE